MKSIRQFSGAFLIAAVLATGLGTVTLEAKKPGGGGGDQPAICSYLESVLSYPYLSEWIRQYVLGLWKQYECGG